MILAIPLLSGSMSAGLLVLTALKSVGVLVAVLVCAYLLVPRLLRLIANTRQRELFVLSVFLVCIGTAWLMSTVGVSLALGAFLAGLVVAGSGFRDQALSDLIPFREVFASIFFVSVGMLLDPRAIATNAMPILIMVAAIVLGKALITTLTGLALRLPLRVSILSGLALAQVGEFSFVLMATGRDAMVLPQPLTDNLSVAIVVTMLITPLIITASPHVAAGVVKVPVLTRRLGVRLPDDRPDGSGPLKDHVIIAGYGLTGQEISHTLADCGVDYVIVDINPENVRRALQHGEPAFFGDITSADVLQALGVERARELVVAVNDIGASARAIRETRRLAPALPVIVRVQYAIDVERLVAAGATEVVAAELQASVVMTRLILDRCQRVTDSQA
jgi:CPA2 family monovalent cation:H+ antiporter-2